MQTFARLLTLILVLALGAGPFASALAAPLTMQSAMMADEMGSAMAGMDMPAGDCALCKSKPGAMTDCLPTCISMPGLVSEEPAELVLLTAIYEPLLELSFSGAQRRPDPYPPRPIILS
jgi:hypothetical protein